MSRFRIKKLMSTRNAQGLIYLRNALLLLVVTICGCTATTTVQHNNLNAIDLAQLDPADVNRTERKTLETLPVENLIQNGRTHLSRQNIALARLHFLVAFNKDKSSVPALIGFAQTLEQSRDNQKALKIYNLALEKDPESIEALVGIGRLERKKGSNQKALEFLIRAMNIDDKNAKVLAEIAITYDVSGKYLLAESLYLEAINLNSDSSANFNNFGVNYLLQKRYTESIREFEKALSIDPNNQRIRNNLASAYALVGKEGKALQIFEGTLDKASAYNNLGYLYMTHGRWEEAERALKTALDLNPIFYVRAFENLEQLKRVRSEQIN